MFFTTIEEWIGLAIAFPFCVAIGIISRKLAEYKIRLMKDKYRKESE